MKSKTAEQAIKLIHMKDLLCRTGQDRIYAAEGRLVAAEAHYRRVVQRVLSVGTRVTVERKNCRTGDYEIYGTVKSYGSNSDRVNITNERTGKPNHFSVTCHKWRKC